MFSWKPIYQELASKILEYRDRQDVLLQWLAEMKALGIPVVKLGDENPKGTTVPLAEIDPFSFFSNFNRGIKVEYRVRCLEILKEKMGLSSPVPSDFDGIPHVSMLKALFFPYEYNRKDHMTPTLWDFAQEVATREPAELSGELFSRCLDIPQVGLAKLTIGMFWMRPDHYLAMDSLMMDYVEEKGLKIGDGKSLNKYREAMAQIEATLGQDYPQISRDAYLFANKLPVSADVLDAGLEQLLQAQAKKNDLTVDQVVTQLLMSTDGDEKENEITNRLRTMPMAAEVLARRPIDVEELKNVCTELWVLANGTDSIRRNAFLASDTAGQAILDLLDEDAGGDESARIDTFIDVATANGYAGPDSSDAAAAAQFASTLLSAVYPEQFVDFRQNRWNKLFSLLADSKKRLCTGNSYGWKLIRAGKFAAALAATETFRRHFGDDNGTWKAAGLAWCFRKGPFDMDIQTKQYWAGAGLNTVLYGPPGTGKTYQSTHTAVALVDGAAGDLTPDKRQSRFDELLDKGRIAFITFHQSFAYEDFVEGIRPVLEKDAADGAPRYECRDGIFKRIAIEALYSSLERPEAESQEAEFEVRWRELTSQIEEVPDREYEGLTEKTRYILAVSAQGNITAQNLRNPDASHYICGRRNMKKVFVAHPGKTEIAIREINETLGVGSHAHLATVVFRALMGIDATPESKAGERQTAASYDERKQIVLEYLETREETGYGLMSPDLAPRYVLVIDEINRGNISKILGELVTLLEPDKRVGAGRQLRVTLPYSGDVFGVPQNLYIVGTMNTADKSIALVDVALRRRFEFQELMPDFSVCSALPDDLRRILVELNKRIALRKDRDHQIGHSYFMDVTTAAEFNEQFAKTTIPLLQEYFYNDWDGLRFVLGEEKKEGGAFIRATDHSGSKWARNRWQWFSDTQAAELDYVTVLNKNYKQHSSEPQDDA